MVTNSTLGMLDMKSIQEYFGYIIDSKINGQHTQAKDLFNQLSDAQSDEFFNWIEEAYFYEALDNGDDIESELESLINYFRK
jgi:hypothetical protein